MERGGGVSVDAAVVQDNQTQSFLKPRFLVYPRDLKNAHFKWHFKGASSFVSCIENIQGARQSFSTSEQEGFFCAYAYTISTLGR